MGTICPYCDIEVSESSIEAEDGCCPECGAMISVSSNFEASEEDNFEDDYDDFEEDDFDDDEFIDNDPALGDFDDEEEAFDEDFEEEEEF